MLCNSGVDEELCSFSWICFTWGALFRDVSVDANFARSFSYSILWAREKFAKWDGVDVSFSLTSLSSFFFPKRSIFPTWNSLTCAFFPSIDSGYLLTQLLYSWLYLGLLLGVDGRLVHL